MPVEPDQLTSLRHEADLLKARYASTAGDERLTRLEGSIKRRTHRLAFIRNQIEELSREASVLDRELLGFQTGLTAYLADLVERIRNDHGEGWSPSPVIGYRMWAWGDDSLEGVRTSWTGPEMVASCGAGYDNIEVPHTDGRCGRLGCGIYAAKRPDRVLDAFTPTAGQRYVVGRVELTGKVVEHDLGYRAQRARVVAVVAVTHRGVLASRDRVQIEQLFTDPVKTAATLSRTTPWSPAATSSYLTATGSENQWT